MLARFHRYTVQVKITSLKVSYMFSMFKTTILFPICLQIIGENTWQVIVGYLLVRFLAHYCHFRGAKAESEIFFLCRPLPHVTSPIVIPRQYPYRFGLRILRILPKLLKRGAKMPLQPPHQWDALEMFKAWPLEDVWADAELDDVYVYLRGNRGLNLPMDWRPVFEIDLGFKRAGWILANCTLPKYSDN